MTPFVEQLNYLLGLGALFLQVSAAILALSIVFRHSVTVARTIVEFIGYWGLWISLALSLFASALSLYYSEVVGMLPCSLCWLQRVFLYPQIIMLALAIRMKDRAIVAYSLALSAIGGAIALYHHILQMGGAGSLPCPASGTVSCAQRLIFEWGYITFPLMSFSVFLFLIAAMLAVRTRNIP